MKLLSLLEHLEYKCLQGSTDQEVSSVVYDSRKVEEGSLFICIRGAVVDGHICAGCCGKGSQNSYCGGTCGSSF